MDESKWNQFLNDREHTEMIWVYGAQPTLSVWVTEKKDVLRKHSLTNFPDTNHPEQLNLYLFYSVCHTAVYNTHTYCYGGETSLNTVVL